MKKVRIGLVGTGFIADIHMHAYRRVYGIDVEVVGVCSRSEKASEFARRYKIPKVSNDYRNFLKDPDIDVIDICTPPQMHHSMIEECVIAGKHVICEKPFTGYFGGPGATTPVGGTDRKIMFDAVMERMEKTCDIIRKGDALFMYAEDWVYAPTVTKAAEILDKTKDKILFLKAEESHSGSHAWHAAEWEQSGGGALIRQGCHPLSAAIHLKMIEAKARGESFGITAVTCEVGNVAASLTEDERRFIAARPVDVEDWAMLTLSYTDGTKATVFAGDFVMGGVINQVEFHTNTTTVQCNISRNNMMPAYFADNERARDIYLTEKVEHKGGWQFLLVEEESMRGYTHEMQDFMECVTLQRMPVATLDLAYETIKATYAGYLSAEKGIRVMY